MQRACLGLGHGLDLAKSGSPDAGVRLVHDWVDLVERIPMCRVSGRTEAYGVSYEGQKNGREWRNDAYICPEGLELQG